MVCFPPGSRSRLIYSFRVHPGRKGEPKGFAWQDYRDLIVRVHNQLGGLISLVWDRAVERNVEVDRSRHRIRHQVERVVTAGDVAVERCLTGAQAELRAGVQGPSPRLARDADHVQKALTAHAGAVHKTGAGRPRPVVRFSGTGPCPRRSRPAS